MADQLLEEKVLQFSTDILTLTRQLENLSQPIIARQLLSSATSIGASVYEAKNSESRDDFIHKMKISSKEAGETKYWLKLSANIVKVEQVMFDQLESIHKMVNKSIITCRKNKGIK